MKARVIHLVTKLELGGAQQNTLYTVGHLDRERFSVALWAGDGGILNDDARAIPGLDFVIVPELVREISPKNDWAALWKLRRMLKAEAAGGLPVVVHTHSSKAGILGRIAAWLAGVPVIIHTYHGFGFNDFQRLPVKWAYIAAEWLTGRVTDESVAVSRANLDRAVHLGLAPVGHIRLIRSGIAIADFAPRPIDRAVKRRELGLDPDLPLALMVACLKQQKCPLDFVRVAAEAIKHAPEAQFAIAGDGELRPELEAAIRDAGLANRFKLLGWRRDVPELLWCADALVLTSLWEGLPRVYPQAMAAGLPVVGTCVDGAAEAVCDGETGWLFAPHDVAGMATRLGELLNDPARAREMGAAGRARVAEFDIDLMVRQQEELYEQALARAGRQEIKN